MTETKEYIRVSELDQEFKFEISKRSGGESIKACFACGSCDGGCPVRRIFPDYHPRKIVHMALLGMKDRVLSSPLIWLCSTCYTCYERCPQKVKLCEVMNVLKNMATEAGYAPEALTMQPELFSKFGRLYEIDDFDNKKRDKLGLPAVKMKAEDVAKIMKICKLQEVRKLGS